ncbi:15269_t:CDS:2 [Dentiscutata erythropus]|uniref:15269_t:CDS:1 n=1 Tax=Dentiscutata erythropus TaxID=1348616 RepID=A0A9N9EYC7_9GLOM|nr:15269_t:CDS:2 [Dentiscutata erythropus]
MECQYITSCRVPFTKLGILKSLLALEKELKVPTSFVVVSLTQREVFSSMVNYKVFTKRFWKMALVLFPTYVLSCSKECYTFYNKEKAFCFYYDLANKLPKVAKFSPFNKRKILFEVAKYYNSSKKQGHISVRP